MTTSIPQIGEVIELFHNGEWQTDFLIMKRFDHMVDKVHYVESGVLFWGGIKERYEEVDRWREKQYSTQELEKIYGLS